MHEPWHTQRIGVIALLNTRKTNPEPTYRFNGASIQAKQSKDVEVAVLNNNLKYEVFNLRNDKGVKNCIIDSG